MFGPKPWVNPFEKMSIFRLFQLFVFIGQKGVFSCKNIVKKYFPGLYCLKKKKLKKWPFLDQNHGLTPLEKCQFFDFLNFLFLQPRKAFFLCQNIVKDIFLSFIALKKNLKNGHFWTKTLGLPFGKMSNFRIFELLVFKV